MQTAEAAEPQRIVPPFAPGEEILLNGRFLFLFQITEKVLIFRRDYGKQPPAGTERKAFMAGAQFEWKKWRFEIVKVQSPKFKRGKKMGQFQEARHFELHCRPLAIRRADDDEIRQVLERIHPPAIDSREHLEAWQAGVQGYFEQKRVDANPHGGLLVSPHEGISEAARRQGLRTFWERGWSDAARAASEVLPQGPAQDEPPAPARQPVVDVPFEGSALND